MINFAHIINKVSVMRKILALAVMAVISVVSFNAAASDRIVSYEQLPQPAKVFITAHFADSQVAYAKIDDGRYEVRMADGTELEFSRKGEWVKVDCEHNVVPESVLELIPEGIKTYVEANFPGAAIVKVDRERSARIEVELDNDLDLVFGKKGNFLRIDD